MKSFLSPSLGLSSSGISSSSANIFVCFFKSVASVVVGFGDVYLVGFLVVAFSPSEEFPPDDAVLYDDDF